VSLQPVLRSCVGKYRVNLKNVNSCRCRRQILAHRTGKRYVAICGCFLALHYVISATCHHFAKGRQALLGDWFFLATLVFTYEFYVVRTVHFAVKLYNDQRNAQFLNLFIYLLLPYMFRAFFFPIFRGRGTTLAVVQVVA
jgi:hypothetical protein